MDPDDDTDGRPSKVIPPLSLRGMNSITFAGLLMIYTAIAAFAGSGYLLYDSASADVDSLTRYAPAALAGAVGVFTALLGVRLVRAGGLSPSDPLPVVNPVEWKILSTAIIENKEDPVGQYIRLSSLTGSTGLFTKLGLSGLPLATIALTLFFALASLFAREPEQFYELTQLTLGAFIGSFVQKQVGALREAAAADARLPAGGPSTGTAGGGASISQPDPTVETAQGGPGSLPPAAAATMDRPPAGRQSPEA